MHRPKNSSHCSYHFSILQSSLWQYFCQAAIGRGRLCPVPLPWSPPIVLGPVPLLGIKRASCRVSEGIWSSRATPHLGREHVGLRPGTRDRAAGEPGSWPGGSAKPTAAGLCQKGSSCGLFFLFLMRETRWALGWVLAGPRGSRWWPWEWRRGSVSGHGATSVHG